MPFWFGIGVDLKGFFEHLPDLLNGPGARFSFFNGLGATSTSRPTSHHPSTYVHPSVPSLLMSKRKQTRYSTMSTRNSQIYISQTSD